MMTLQKRFESYRKSANIQINLNSASHSQGYNFLPIHDPLETTLLTTECWSSPAYNTQWKLPSEPRTILICFASCDLNQRSCIWHKQGKQATTSSNSAIMSMFTSSVVFITCRWRKSTIWRIQWFGYSCFYPGVRIICWTTNTNIKYEAACLQRLPGYGSCILKGLCRGMCQGSAYWDVLWFVHEQWFILRECM